MDNGRDEHDHLNGDPFSLGIFARFFAIGMAIFVTTTSILTGKAPLWMWRIVIGSFILGSLICQRPSAVAADSDFINAHMLLTAAFGALVLQNDPYVQVRLVGDTAVDLTAAVSSIFLSILWTVPTMSFKRRAFLWFLRGFPVLVAVHLSLADPQTLGVYLSKTGKITWFVNLFAFTFAFHWLRRSYVELLWNMVSLSAVSVPFAIWNHVDVVVYDVVVSNAVIIIACTLVFSAVSARPCRQFCSAWIHAVVSENGIGFVVTMVCLAIYANLSKEMLNFMFFGIACGIIALLVRQNQKELEAAIARNRTLSVQVRQRLYCNMSGAIAFDIDANSDVVWVTGETDAVLGYTHSQWQALRVFDTIFTPASKVLADQALDCIRRGEPTRTVELQALHRVGRKVWLKLDRTSQRVDGNAFIVLHAITADTRQTQPSSTIGGSGVLHITTDLTLHLGVDGDVLGVTGYTDTEFLALNHMYDFLSPEADHAHVISSLEAMAASSQAQGFDTRYRHKDGHTLWLRVSPESRVVGTTASGKPELLLVLHDVTEIVSAKHEAMLAQEALLRRMELVPAMVFEMVSEDALGTRRLKDVSAHCQNIYGLSPPQMESSRAKWMDMLHPDDANQYEASMNKSQVTMRPWDHRFRIVVDGKTKYLHGVAMPRLEGTTVVWTGMLQDVTVQHNLREMTNKRDEQRAIAVRYKMACAYLSHEIRNQLYPQTLILDEIQDATTRWTEGINTMLDANSTVNNILNRVLDLSKWESNEIPVDVSLFSILRLFTSIALYARAKAKNATVEGLAIIKPTWFARADQHLLKQAATNLISNAAKFSDGRPISVVMLFEQKDSGSGTIVVTVTDTGRGMTPEQLGKVMVPFAQVRKAGEAQSGTGLGLSLTKAMVEFGHNGALTLESEGLGKGTKAIMRVPVLWVDQREALPEESEPLWWVALAPGAAADVLVVDDVHLCRQATTSSAEKLGLTFHEATTGEQAVELLRKNKYSIVFMDRRMPGIDGEEATQQARENGYTLPIVMTSGVTFEPREKTSLKAMGITAFLNKLSVPGTRHAMKILKDMKDHSNN